MQWTNNAIQFELTGHAGRCPRCGAELIADTYTYKDRMSIWFICNKYEAFAEFCGRVPVLKKNTT